MIQNEKCILNCSNKKYWNIVKGVGISCIVLGHTNEFFARFVYLFHLIVFFFLSGYFYSEKKYGDNLTGLIVERTKKNWIKYVGFSCFFVVIHNILLRKGLILNGIEFSKKDILINIINSFFFESTEIMCGALWFIPVQIFAVILLGFIIFFSRRINKSYNGSKDIIIIIFTVLLGGVGVYFARENEYIHLHVQTSFLVLPFMMFGYYFRKLTNFDNLLKIVPCIVAFIFLVKCAYIDNNLIELSVNQIGKLHMFYLISILGIYLVLYISKLIYLSPIISNVFSFFGEHSFEIMASHFFVIKSIDLIVAKIYSIADSATYGVFPYAFSNLWPIYLVCSLLLPSLLFKYFKNIKISSIKNIKISSIFQNEK